MKILKPLYFVLCASTAIGLAFPALAQDADDFSAKLSAAYGAAGYELKFGPSTVDGDTISYDGLTVIAPAYGKTAEDPLVLDTVFTFNGVAENDDGSYTAASLTVPDVDYENEGVKVNIQNIAADNIYVPAVPAKGSLAMLQLLSGGSAGPVVFTNAGKEVFSIAKIGSTGTFDPEQGTDDLAGITADFDATDIKADLSVVTEAEPRAMIDALGINTITGSAHEEMDWTMDDGRMNIGDLSLTLDNLGKLAVATEIVGYTPEAMDAMVTANADIAKLPEAERAAAEEKMGTEMAAKFAISGFSLRYEDASLANKLIDLFAAQQGATRTDFIAGIKMIAPMLLAQSGDTALATQASEAINTFLDDPKSLTISINPGRDVPLTELLAGGEDPAAAIALLKPSIVANTAAE